MRLDVGKALSLISIFGCYAIKIYILEQFWEINNDENKNY